MASTRSIRKRAQKKVLDGNRFGWALETLQAGLNASCISRLSSAASLPESVAAELRKIDACPLADEQADRLLTDIRKALA